MCGTRVTLPCHLSRLLTGHTQAVYLATGLRRLPLSKIGAFAEYACVRADAPACVPTYLTDEEAAAVPLTALTAWQSYELMGVKAGQSVFISGGTGSLGAMVIPLGKVLGLTVNTNGSGKNRDRVMKLGADRFVDYREQDYTEVFHAVDYVLDTLGEKELPREFSILTEGGTLVSLTGMPNSDFADVNAAMAKVAASGSRGKTVLRIA